MKSVLITGANFNNKGAQSMLFVTVDEIKKRIPGVKVYFAVNGRNDDYCNLSFDTVYMNKESIDLAIGKKNSLAILLKRKIKDFIKPIIGMEKYPTSWLYELKSIIHELSIIIDISGYALGSQFGFDRSENYLNYLRLAHNTNTPIVLMPQSFGPFNYDSKNNLIRRDIAFWLKKALKIYARETNGFNLLTKEFGLNNVEKSYDIVLKSEEIDLNNIYKSIPKFNVPKVSTLKNVSIVPNNECFKRSDNRVLIDRYSLIINKLLKSGINVYLIRHSREDLAICKRIKEIFANNDNVILIENDLNCFEYEKLIKKFDFCLCSRFHGIVHSYKNGIPCIILGWAIKYKELAECVNQDDFIFDFTAKEINMNKIINAIEKMSFSFKKQSQIISDALKRIKKDNCFEFLESYLNKQM